MDLIALSALFLAALVNAAIPGPAVLLVVARATDKGLFGGALAALGRLTAVALLLGAVWAILLGVLQLGPEALLAMRVAGVVVLLALGVHMLRNARRGGAIRPTAGASDFSAGVTLVLSNPVNLVFFLALVPQFVDAAARDAGLILLASGLVLLGSAISLVVASSRLRHILARLARWVRENAKGESLPAPPPVAVVKPVLATPDPALPVLTGIVNTPVFGRSGTLITTPGYHPDARLTGSGRSSNDASARHRPAAQPADLNPTTAAPYRQAPDRRRLPASATRWARSRACGGRCHRRA